MQRESACPSRPELERFALGLLSTLDASPLEQHLLSCTSCLQALPQLGEDVLVQAMRAHVRAAEPEADLVADLLQRVQQLCPGLRQDVEGGTSPFYPHPRIAGPAGPDLASPEPANADRHTPGAADSLPTPGSSPITTDDVTRTRGPAADAPPAVSARYRIVRSHARGGLGEVFVAHDHDLHREVALKGIQEQHADHPESRARFLLEAEITSRLEHPGIVPVYGLGRYEDGRPFYTMRFIKGDSLKQAIDAFHQADKSGRDPGERALAFRQLLRRFVDVCNAVGYAHSRGVLHRDLKPANVMLGKYGETLLVDWGLAKPLRQAEPQIEASEGPLLPITSGDSSATQLGQALGTPAYMSPEQAAGRNDLVGPASDIYGLGAMLYTVLTGHAPVEDIDKREVLQRVRQGDWPRPSRIKRNTPPPLEALCLKAMALDPTERYASALELASDIEHWLADEPVSCYRAPLPARLGRWARRHKTLVAATVAAVVMALLIGGGGTWRLERQRAERAAAEANRQGKLRERVENTLPEVTRLQERARWDQARAILQQLDNQLALDGTDDLKLRVAEARRNLDLIARLDAAAFLKAVIVLERPDEDSGSPANRSTRGGINYKEADRAYGRAFSEGKLGTVGEDVEQVASRVRQSAVRSALLAALDDWAFVAHSAAEPVRRNWVLAVARTADPDPWRDRVRSPIAWDLPVLMRQLLKEAPREDWSPQLLAAVSFRIGNKEEEIALLRAAQLRHPDDFWLNAILGGALRLDLESVGYYRAALALRPDRIDIYNDLGVALRRLGRNEEALAVDRQSCKLFPNLALPHENMGFKLRHMGRFEEALLEYRKAAELEPKNAKVHFGLGLALADLKRGDEAMAEYQQAIELDPNYPQPRVNLGRFLRSQGHREEALAQFRRANDLDPKLPQARSNLASLLVALGRHEEAMTVASRALDLAPNDPMAHNGLGVVYYELQKAEEARAEFRKAIELDPQFTMAHSNLGNALQLLRRHEEAVQAYRKAIEIDPRFSPPHRGLGSSFHALGRYEEAQVEYQKAIELDPTDAHTHLGFGALLRKLNRPQEALAEYRKAVQLPPQLANAHRDLASMLIEMGRQEEAEPEFRRVTELEPRSAPAYGALGICLSRLGRHKDAETSFRKAIELRPLEAMTHYQLGWALAKQNKLDEAVAEYRQALALNAKLVEARADLGSALGRLARWEEAMVEYHKAIAVDPKNARPHLDLGWALYQQGELEEAVKEYRQALVLNPTHALAHNDLGLALYDLGQREEALREYHEAIACDPKLDHPHTNLGKDLLEHGLFAEAAAEYRKAIELNGKGDGQVRRCERLQALSKRLPALVSGEERPADAREQFELGEMCRHTRRFERAVGFYSDAFTADPRLAEDVAAWNRYNAACAAALAGCGLGDAAELDDAAKARFRGQALQWLARDLGHWTQKTPSDKPAERLQARSTLRHWKRDPDLAGVRDSAALAKLPPSECAAWQKLWQDADAVLRK